MSTLDEIRERWSKPGVERVYQSAKDIAFLLAEVGQLQAIVARLADDPTLVEAVAAWDHDEAWSRWYMYQMANLDFVHKSGEPFRERWARQAATPYRDLSETEKESDRIEARRVLVVIRVALGVQDD